MLNYQRVLLILGQQYHLKWYSSALTISRSGKSSSRYIFGVSNFGSHGKKLTTTAPISMLAAICQLASVSKYTSYLVGGFKHGFYFPLHIWDVILPIDFHIFQDGYCTTNQLLKTLLTRRKFPLRRLGAIRFLNHSSSGSAGTRSISTSLRSCGWWQSQRNREDPSRSYCWWFIRLLVNYDPRYIISHKLFVSWKKSCPW